MLTKLRIQNFKQFDDVEIELGPITVFAGPNNSGKTTALQALALWGFGISRLADVPVEKLMEGFLGQQVPVVERSELTSAPVPDARMLWHKLRTELSSDGRTEPEEWSDIDAFDISILADGSSHGQDWQREIRFAFVNEASLEILQKPLSADLLLAPTMFLLPSMSGIVINEPLHQPGTLNRLVGEGRTAEILRNLCFRLYEEPEKQGWSTVAERMKAQFGVDLLPPRYLPGSGLITMQYRERNGYALDIASAGRGMLQTLLLLAYLYTYPGAVLLLDEPDAHLEIIRQRDIYHLLTGAAASQGSQIILATHSEVILREAFERKDTVIAFTGRPHRLTDIGNFVKSLSLIPAEDYLLADQRGWILYCEGETDALVLKAMAARLQHPALPHLHLVFSKDIDGNEPSEAKKHFTGLREAYPNLSGIAVFDRVSKGKLEDAPPGLRIVSWTRREIENYFMQPATLAAYARASSKDEREAARREQIMREVVQGNTPPFALENHRDDFWSKTKASDEYLDRIFAQYSERAGVPLQLRKADYHLLVQYIPEDLIDPEVTEKLDAILEVARHAKSLEE